MPESCISTYVALCCSKWSQTASSTAALVSLSLTISSMARFVTLHRYGNRANSKILEMADKCSAAAKSIASTLSLAGWHHIHTSQSAGHYLTAIKDLTIRRLGQIAPFLYQMIPEFMAVDKRLSQSYHLIPEEWWTNDADFHVLRRR